MLAHGAISEAGISDTSTSGDQWSATFAPSRFTLSNGNLTASATLTNQTDTIISVISNSTGKFYFEMTCVSSGEDLAWGLAKSNQSNTSLLGSNNPSPSVGFRNSGNWRINNSEIGSGIPSAPNNETIGFAVDLTNSLIWVRKTASPSNWYGNGAGDPVARTNGFSISSLAGQALFLAYTSNQNGPADASTMNAGASAFAASAPTGYIAWQTPPPDPALFLPARRNRTYLIR
jgi:hypothetical protein